MNIGCKFKIYSADATLMGTTAYAEDAAILVSAQGDGATVRVGRTVVWTEGQDHDGEAGESYDLAAELIHDRLRGV